MKFKFYPTLVSVLVLSLISSTQSGEKDPTDFRSSAAHKLEDRKRESQQTQPKAELTIVPHGIQEDAFLPSLHLALREYQIFHAKDVRRARVKLFCDQHHVLQREELWPLEKTKQKFKKIRDLAALSFDGCLFVAFNPRTEELETYDVDSGKLIRSISLHLKDCQTFHSIYSITPGYMTYCIDYSYSKKFTTGTAQTGFTTHSSGGNLIQLYLFCVNDGKSVKISDDQYFYFNLGNIQRSGWDLMNMADDDGNIYIHSSMKVPDMNFGQDIPYNPTQIEGKTRVWSYNIASNKKEFLYSFPHHLTTLTFDSKGHLVFAESCINKNQSYFEVDQHLRLTSVFSVAQESHHDFKGTLAFPLHKTMILLDRRFTDKRVPVLYQWGSGFPVHRHLMSQTQMDQLKSDVKFALTNLDHPDQLLYVGTTYDKKRIDVVGEGDPLLLEQFMKISDVKNSKIGLSLAPTLRRVIVQLKDKSERNNELTVCEIDRQAGIVNPIFTHTLDIPEPPNRLKFSKTSFVEIKAADGVVMPSYLTLPSNLTPEQHVNLPVFMYIHGGPHARDKLRFDPMVQFLSSRRMAVLQVNYPGSTGFGKKYEHASDGHWDRVIRYIHDARNWLVKNGIADPEKIAIGGTSFGAYATVANLQRYPMDYQCGIAVNGIYDLQLELKRESEPEDLNFGIARQFSGIYGPHSPHTAALLKKLSPALNEGKIYTPLLLLHATADKICPLAQAESLVTHHPELRLTYGQFKDDEHTLQKVEHRLIEAALTEAFLSKHLGTFSTPLDDVLKIPTFKWIKTS